MKYIIITLILLMHTVLYADESVYSLSTYQQTLYNNCTIIKPTIKDNKVWAGMWICPLSGTIQTESSHIDIINLVSLSWALKHGAMEWKPERLKFFTKDPLNNIVVSKEIARLRGDKGFDEWLPSNLTVALSYINKCVTICDKYNLEYSKEDLNKIKENIILVISEYPNLK